LASTFRSAMERAGLEFRVNCVQPSAPVYVDRDMWEKIVLNLVSNAFKFTLTGSVKLSIAENDGHVALTVEDTGTGIPEHELPRLFERFQRVEGLQARSHEGPGSGLALVHELVKLHGGELPVESKVGDGTRFTVTTPAGHDHLPPDQIEEAVSVAATA